MKFIFYSLSVTDIGVALLLQITRKIGKVTKISFQVLEN